MDYDDIYDYRETNSDLNELKCQHQETELYKEIIYCMNWLYPEWNSNRGIGSSASEFILTAIQNFDYIEEFNDRNRRENLKIIYEELSISYIDSKKWYQATLEEKMYDKFKASMIDAEIIEDSCDVEYDNLFSRFKEKEMNKVYYQF